MRYDSEHFRIHRKKPSPKGSGQEQPPQNNQQINHNHELLQNLQQNPRLLRSLLKRDSQLPQRPNRPLRLPSPRVHAQWTKRKGPTHSNRKQKVLPIHRSPRSLKKQRLVQTSFFSLWLFAERHQDWKILSLSHRISSRRYFWACTHGRQDRYRSSRFRLRSIRKLLILLDSMFVLRLFSLEAPGWEASWVSKRKADWNLQNDGGDHIKQKSRRDLQ